MTTPIINIVYVAIPDSLIDGVLVELPQLISDNDLHITASVNYNCERQKCEYSDPFSADPSYSWMNARISN